MGFGGWGCLQGVSMGGGEGGRRRGGGGGGYFDCCHFWFLIDGFGGWVGSVFFLGFWWLVEFGRLAGLYACLWIASGCVCSKV